MHAHNARKSGNLHSRTWLGLWHELKEQAMDEKQNELLSERIVAMVPAAESMSQSQSHSYLREQLDLGADIYIE